MAHFMIEVHAGGLDILNLECEDEEDVGKQMRILHTHKLLQTYNLPELVVCVKRNYASCIPDDMRHLDQTLLASTNIS